MKKQDFYRYVENHIKEYIPNLESVSIESVRKNNGVCLDALYAKTAGMNTSPIIYLEQYYDEVANGEATIDQAMEKIAYTYGKYSTKDYDDIGEVFRNFDFVRDKIIMKVLGMEKNEELLQHVPYTEKEDLAIVYSVCLNADENNLESILIRNEHMEHWNVTVEELHELATKNSNRILPASVMTVTDFLKSAFGETVEMIKADFELYIVSNVYATNGAAAMFYSDALADIAEKEQRDLVVLPSSVNEVIAIPYDKAMDMTELAWMVNEINRTHLEETEVLSDHVYVYSSKEREIKIADVTLEQLHMEQQKRREETQKKEPEESVSMNSPSL